MKLTVKLPWDILSTVTPSPGPPRTSLFSKTLRKDLEERWALTSFQMLDLYETSSKASLGYIEYPETISSSINNIPVLKDSTRFVSGLILTKSWPKVGTIILTFSEPYYTRNWKNLNNWMENFRIKCILKFYYVPKVREITQKIMFFASGHLMKHF